MKLGKQEIQRRPFGNVFFQAIIIGFDATQELVSTHRFIKVRRFEGSGMSLRASGNSRMESRLILFTLSSRTDWDTYVYFTALRSSPEIPNEVKAKPLTVNRY